jgi:hypothetical protein
LFARYLYQHKELNLPGIGTFQIDASVSVPEPHEKHFHDFLQQIRYTQKPVAAADPSFIDFIRTETGKIRPLAESDLDSYLSDGKILLNIGKPFHLEGIGSLLKTREGVYQFKPGEPLFDKLQTGTVDAGREHEKKSFGFENEPAPSHAMTRFLIFAAIVGGIIFIIWAGYNVFRRYTDSSAATTMEQTDSVQATTAVADSSRAGAILTETRRIIDSINSRPSAAPPGHYRFVIEKTSNSTRAHNRFAQLKKHVSDIQMDVKDSTLYSLYFLLPASAADTARIRDSLKSWYASRMVYVEKP